jgi:hypothetical protein
MRIMFVIATIRVCICSLRLGAQARSAVYAFEPNVKFTVGAARTTQVTPAMLPRIAGSDSGRAK